MHAQTCARAQMCDVVAACIRGMKGRRLFNTLVKVVSQREVIVFLQQALQNISQSVGYVKLILIQQVMQLEGIAIRDYVPAFFFFLSQLHDSYECTQCIRNEHFPGWQQIMFYFIFAPQSIFLYLGQRYDPWQSTRLACIRTWVQSPTLTKRKIEPLAFYNSYSNCNELTFPYHFDLHFPHHQWHKVMLSVVLLLSCGVHCVFWVLVQNNNLDKYFQILFLFDCLSFFLSRSLLVCHSFICVLLLLLHLT